MLNLYKSKMIWVIFYILRKTKLKGSEKKRLSCGKKVSEV